MSRPDVRSAVLAYLIANPTATPWQTAADLPFRRQDVLRLCKAFRAAGIVKSPADGSRGAGTGSPAETRCPSCGAGLEIRVR